MRTTIRLDDELLREAKQVATRTGKSLTALIEEALRETLARQRESSTLEPVHLVVVTGSGMQPGVDLDDSASLLDLMDASSHDPA
jgi:hypothetical protein